MQPLSCFAKNANPVSSVLVLEASFETWIGSWAMLFERWSSSCQILYAS